MNGPQHYHHAEEWLTTAHKHSHTGDSRDTAIAAHAVRAAQVHATLALAAATAAQLTGRYVGDDAHINDWHKAVSS